MVAETFHFVDVIRPFSLRPTPADVIDSGIQTLSVFELFQTGFQQ